MIRLTLFFLFCFNTLPLIASQVSEPETLKPEPHQRDPYNWQERHLAVINRNQTTKPEYVIIGDSITHRWGGEPADTEFHPSLTGSSSWNHLFGNHKVTNMGFGFDYVDNAYYRIQNGELDGISPRVVILLIGTNNIAHRKDSAKTCADNTRALVSLLKKKCPNSTILLLGILPRKEKQLAPIIKEVNTLYKKIADGKKVIFANPGSTLLQKDSDSMPQDDLMADSVHLNTKGYDKLGKELSRILKKIDKKYSPKS